MPGFFVSNSVSEISLRDTCSKGYIKEKLNASANGCTVLRQTLDKFQQDKAFEENNNLIIVLEGYLLNKTELLNKYNVNSVGRLIEIMLEKCGEEFFGEFRGCFAGAVFVKSDKKWIVFTNQIGDNPVFYTMENGIFAAGSQIQYLKDFCIEQGIHLDYNEECAYQLLTYGYIAADDTYVKQINRLHGGDYLVVTEDGVIKRTYHRFEAHPEKTIDKTEEEIVDLIEEAFSKAVRLEWEKDDEYGYRHLADLSGGLDSRMNIWVAHEQKDRHLSIVTYSKEGELDELISKQIAAYWNDELLFKPLDDFSFMKDIDENTELLGGLSLYSGITGGKQLLQDLNLSSFGIEHTGMVGDSSLGSFFHNHFEQNNKTPTGRYSEKLADKLPERITKLYENYIGYNVYLMYVRGFHGACNTHLLRRNYTEVGSPFLNVDFMQLCFNISEELRMNHYIYKKWIVTKHPEAADFKWEKIDGKITEKDSVLILRKLAKKGPRKILKSIGVNPKSGYGMNPMDYWLSKYPSVKSFLDQYEKEAVNKWKGVLSDELLHDIDMLYRMGNATEKSMSLTVLSSVGLYLEN